MTRVGLNAQRCPAAPKNWIRTFPKTLKITDAHLIRPSNKAIYMCPWGDTMCSPCIIASDCPHNSHVWGLTDLFWWCVEAVASLRCQLDQNPINWIPHVGHEVRQNTEINAAQGATALKEAWFPSLCESERGQYSDEINYMPGLLQCFTGTLTAPVPTNGGWEAIM